MRAEASELVDRLRDRSSIVGVVGLGYVGLPAACLLAEAGFKVIGVDRDEARAAAIEAGSNPIAGVEPGLGPALESAVAGERLRATTSYEALVAADAVLVCVETPVGYDHQPRFEALDSACRQLGAVLHPGSIVVVESTLAPGTMSGLVQPRLEEASGLAAGSGFLLGHCPERVMPGRLLANMRSMSRVLGGQTPEASEVMAVLYASYVRGDLDLADMLTAELVKTAENAYRDLNIAFANELALICERVGGDVWRVRELVNKSPGRAVLLPGAGVGGHCIPKDPWLLASALGEGAAQSLLAAARRVNDGMPGHVADLVAECLAEAGVQAAGSQVAVLGYAYLEDSDDTRNSPTAALLPALAALGCQVSVHDPFVEPYRGDVFELAAGADCAVVMVAHSAYRGLDLTRLGEVMGRRLLVDARALFGAERLQDAGFQHRILGRGAGQGIFISTR